MRRHIKVMGDEKRSVVVASASEKLEELTNKNGQCLVKNFQQKCLFVTAPFCIAAVKKNSIPDAQKKTSEKFGLRD